MTSKPRTAATDSARPKRLKLSGESLSCPEVAQNIALHGSIGSCGAGREREKRNIIRNSVTNCAQFLPAPTVSQNNETVPYYLCSFISRFISQDTIEEGIYTVAQDKLKLEQDVTGEDGKETVAKKKDVARLLKAALGVELKEKQIGDVGKVYTEL